MSSAFNFDRELNFDIFSALNFDIFSALNTLGRLLATSMPRQSVLKRKRESFRLLSRFFSVFPPRNLKLI